MNVSQLEVFLAIVDTGSLKEAADVVSLTQSAVSYSLSKLEAELGVTLLERGRQGVTVTRIGEEVVEHARSVLSQVDLIRQKTARERRPAAGKIRLGCVSHVPRRLLTGVTRDFQRQYPDVEFVFFEGTPPELTRWLHNNVIDVGMMTVNEHFAVTIPFIQDELKVIVSTNHALATKSQVPLRAVLQELFIGPKTEHGIVNQMLSARNIPPFQSHQEVSAYNTIFAMVREGIGISLMPQTLIDMQYEDLVVLSIEPRMQLSVQLVNNNQLPTAMDFMDSAHRWAKIHGFLPDDM